MATFLSQLRVAAHLRSANPLHRSVSSINTKHPHGLIVRKFSRAVYLGHSSSTATEGDRGTTIDSDELRNFDEYADQMWNEQGEYELLHLMNRLRVPFITQALTGMKHNFESEPLRNKAVLDVGCGGGILSEVRGICALTTYPLHSSGAPTTSLRACGATSCGESHPSDSACRNLGDRTCRPHTLW